MPGMKLHFLKNTAQRGAVAGKIPPLKQVEAILVYGKPEQRAKVVSKLLETVYSLSLNRSTHHILLTLLDRCDSLTRVRLLYQVRRKLLDMSCSPVGNVVVQRMLETLPRRQRREMAEALVLNVDAGELQRLSEHPSGNHVVQKMMEYGECVEVLEAALTACLPTLALHRYGMRVVARYVECVPQGWRVVLRTLLPDGVSVEELSEEDMLALMRVREKDNTSSNGNHSDKNSKKNNTQSMQQQQQQQISTTKKANSLRTNDATAARDETVSEPPASRAVDCAVSDLFAASSRTSCDSLVLRALLKHPLVPYAVKDAICAHLCEYVVDYLDPVQAAPLRQRHTQPQNNTSRTNNNNNGDNSKSARNSAHDTSSMLDKSRGHGGGGANTRRRTEEQEATYMMPVFGESGEGHTGADTTTHASSRKGNSNKQGDASIVHRAKEDQHTKDDEKEDDDEEDTERMEPRHVHTYLALFEFGDDVQRGELWSALRTHALLGSAAESNISSSSTINDATALPSHDEKEPRPHSPPGRHHVLQSRLLGVKATIPIAVAAFKFYAPCRAELYAALCAVTPDDTSSGRHDTNDTPRATSTSASAEPASASSSDLTALCYAAADPVFTLLMRTVLEMEQSYVTRPQRDALCAAAVTLWESPVASPVLQKLVEVDATVPTANTLSADCAVDRIAAADSQSCATRMAHVVDEQLPRIVSHAVGSFLVQALLQFAPEETRKHLVQAILTRTAFRDLHHALATPQGSRVMQKLLAYAEDGVIEQVVQTLIAHQAQELDDANNTDDTNEDNVNADNADGDYDKNNTHDANEDESKAALASSSSSREDVAASASNTRNNSSTHSATRLLRSKERLALHRAQRYDIESHKLISYSLHTHACFVVQALLRETRQRQLEQSRKQLMDALKPHVFDLAVSPCAGRVVLDTMLKSGSAALTEAIRNVVFYRAEEWLSSGPMSATKPGNTRAHQAGDARAVRHGRPCGSRMNGGAVKRERE